MQKNEGTPNLSGAIITEIRTVDKIKHQEPGRFSASSLPGHLIHIVTNGEVEQESGGIIERFSGGDSVWYWENEPIRGQVIKAPWEFYTINFLAPSLPPPPLSERVKPLSRNTMQHAEKLLSIWHSTELSPMIRHIQAHITLLNIVQDLLSAEAREQSAESAAGLWWRLESILRADLSQPINLARLCKLGHCSERTIFRACRAATGLSPIKRIKNLRLSCARGLVRYSLLSISEIAYSTGSERVQEFSRDYRKHFECTPSSDRKQSTNATAAK
jgi:AraC-like DNA-binding protein